MSRRQLASSEDYWHDCKSDEWTSIYPVQKDTNFLIDLPFS